MMRSPISRDEVIATNRLFRSSPKIYYVHPLMVGPAEGWIAHFERCRDLGFDHVASAPLFAPGPSGDVFLAGDLESTHPRLGSAEPADRTIGGLAGACAAAGLRFLLDVVVDRVDRDGPLAGANSGPFRDGAPGSHLPDPRAARVSTRAAHADGERADIAEALLTLWTGRLGRLLDVGVAGFRFVEPQNLPADFWRSLNRDLKRAPQDVMSLAWTPGASWAQLAALAGAGFDGVFSSLPWWDRRASWFVEETELLRRIAPIMACPEAPFGQRLSNRLAPQEDLATAYRHALRLAATTGNGLLVPMGFEFASRQPMDAIRSGPDDLEEARRQWNIDLSGDIRSANALVDRVAALGVSGETRSLTGPDDPATAILRVDADDVRQAQNAIVVLINPDLLQPRTPDLQLDPLTPAAGVALGDPTPYEEAGPVGAPLAPGEIRLLQVRRSAPVRQRRRDAQLLNAALKSPRIAIETITPLIDAGRFAVARVTGESIVVEADIFADGHDVIMAELIWRAADDRDWRRAPMRLVENDRWRGEFAPSRLGRHAFSIEAWSDEYRTLAREIAIKRAAGNADLALEIEEVRKLLDAALGRAAGPHAGALRDALARLGTADPERAIDILLEGPTRDAMAALGERKFLVQYEPAVQVEVERPQASFAAWYELFPRSAAAEQGRHGTFDDVIGRLPTIRAMGFDVLYLPPVHPIGKTNRKGRNNSLVAGPDDLGSPYAIGSEEGGHDAVHPALGTLADFRRLVAAAHQHGLEIALDFAIQCSPDHPWLSQHPGWFRFRPDGSIRFAENPPKKYEDIVNVDFYAETALPDLWTALRDIVLFWVDQGVLLFRVDNPHTKPLPFWEWMIADVRARHPDVIFLSEAFTRPKMMYRLAKIGFSQSYTYFTWRNTKAELIKYITELTTTEPKDFFRPHFFVNTPDINPVFLQQSGRPGFLVRAALAATLSGLWGMYAGFELCEAAPLPGREEYLELGKIRDPPPRP